MTLDDRGRRAARDLRVRLRAAANSSRELGSMERFDRARRSRERNGRLTAVVLAGVVSVGALALIIRALAPVGRDTPADLAPPTGVIVFNQDFVQNGSDSFRSFTVRPDGSDLTEVGPTGSTYCGDNDAPWSPDGRTILCIAFVPGRALGTLGTATIDADGSGYQVLSGPQLPKSFGCSGWSPDGARLLCPFTSNGVYTVNADGRDLLRLTRTAAGSGPSGYASDGSYAYFTVKDASDFRTLFSVNADGTGALTALSPPGVSVHDNEYFDGVSADPSPDGARVAFVADVTNTERGLYVVNIDGSRAHELKTPAGVNPTSAQWSPDGDWITFSGSVPGADYATVYAIHPDGTGLRQVISSNDGCSAFAPIWSPDGAALLFERQCYTDGTIASTSLEIANVDGTAVSKVTDLNGLTSYGWGR
jgi:Tol biopolymer transport system component